MINFSAADLYANQVYLPSAEMTFQLEIKTPVTPPPPVEPPPVSDTTWDSATAYTAGSTVLFRGEQYTAQWWTKGDQPDQAEVWKLADNGTVKEWSADTAYQAKAKVTFQGQLYQAKWWTKGDTPTSSGSPWQRL